ncbi:hypothetical protein W823_23485 [Williamsia sp. D3]|nr:hypothetical protein W823_23485 [Williamsia sp. D3]
MQIDCFSIAVEIDDAIGFGITDPIGEYRATLDVVKTVKLLAKPWPVEDVVA